MYKKHMQGQTYNPSTSQFVLDIFKAKAYKDGKTLKRSKASVKRFSSESALVKAAEERGYQVFDLGLEYLLLPINQDLVIVDGSERKVVFILEIVDTPLEIPSDI